MNKKYILTVSCQDVRGIVASVAGFVAEIDGFIIEAAQFGDSETCRFFQRIMFSSGAKTPEYSVIKDLFASKIASEFNMEFELYDMAYKPKILLMVSKLGHCLNDLLHRYQSGSLNIEIPAIISNHSDMQRLVEWYGIPFYHLPITKDTKQQQESQIIDIAEDKNIDLMVLARYMQILSPELCERFKGKAINIHHSFLPSFKGAKPYHQAHGRGVKLIGATAHYVTPNLDEGPIIEQEVVRVDHTMSAADFVSMGKDIESRVLARAVRFHIERRTLLNGDKTVVF